MFAFTSAKLVGKLRGFTAPPSFVCNGTNGEVFVPYSQFYSGPIYINEYAHGDSKPLATLSDPGPGYPFACAVDPTTGNLAVLNGKNVAIYPTRRVSPRFTNFLARALVIAPTTRPATSTLTMTVRTNSQCFTQGAIHSRRFH